MDLQFTKIEDKDLYAAEAVVNADFNIHLERTAASRLNILQRTPTEGDFEPVYLPSNVQNNTGKTLTVISVLWFIPKQFVLRAIPK